VHGLYLMSKEKRSMIKGTGISRQQKNSEKGFSLIEVLVSILIFSFVVLSITQLYLHSISAEGKNKNYYYAVKFAEEKIIFLKNKKSQIIQDNVNIINETIRFEVSKDNEIVYSRISKLEIIDNLIHLEVQVHWNQKEEYKIETYL